MSWLCGDFIKSQDTTTPLTISVNGAWGSGKSSLMRMLQRELEGRQSGLVRWVELRWVIGWLWGSLVVLIGKLRTIRDRKGKNDHIRVGLTFDPSEDVTRANFEELLGRHVRAFVPIGGNVPEGTVELLTTRARFWARSVARRRKMTPQSHPTVWFNAWKFNDQEQLWSSLALEVMGQLKKKYNLLTRAAFLADLAFRRTDKLKTLSLLARRLVIPLLVGRDGGAVQDRQRPVPCGSGGRDARLGGSMGLVRADPSGRMGGVEGDR